MSNPPDIRYVKHEDIDPSKWDHCLEEAENGLIYGYSDYLDRMAIHWDGLVYGDYQAVMPLTWNKKFNISYLYQPAFTASLGVFGNGLTDHLVEIFISRIPKKFRLIEIALNHGNIFNSLPSYAMPRANYILSLNRSYEELSTGYRENIRRNIRKAIQAHCVCKKDIAVREIIDLSKAIMQKRTRIKETDYSRFEKLFGQFHREKKAVTYGIYSPAGNLLSSAVYFLLKKRAYYILVGNSPDGKTIGASHYLIDSFIRDYAGQDLTLDFEGSDIRNLAFFYGSFGAKQEPYPFVKINRLPFGLRWLKK